MKDNKTRALVYVISKSFSKNMRIVDVKPSKNNWMGYQTYMVRYDRVEEPGVYHTMEFLPSIKTEKAISEALDELEYQGEGKEFPV